MTTVGSRIKERLVGLGMSQAELARRVHLSQPAINGLVQGKARSTPELHRIARELETTPAYLTGETDDPHADAPEAPTLNYEQLELIEYHARLSRADQQILIQVARSMAEKTPPPTQRLHDAPVGFRPEKGG